MFVQKKFVHEVTSIITGLLMPWRSGLLGVPPLLEFDNRLTAMLADNGGR